MTRDQVLSLFYKGLTVTIMNSKTNDIFTLEGLTFDEANKTEYVELKNKDGTEIVKEMQEMQDFAHIEISGENAKWLTN